MFAYVGTLITTLRNDRRAVTALEYALIGSLIALAIVTAASNLGTSISSTFSTIGKSLN
jgi:pilus assembly protein Flp/PilA